MMRNAITVRRGLLVGAAVGVALVVMWRRSRTGGGAVAPAASEQPVEPVKEPTTAPVERPEEPSTPVLEAEEPVLEADEPGLEAEEPVLGAEEPVLEADEPAEQAMEYAEPSQEPVAHEAEPIAHDRDPGEHHRRPAAMTHVGRQRELGPAGWPQPRPLAAPAGSDRPQLAHARATWPGVARAGQLRPTPLRAAPQRARPVALRRSA